MYERGDSSNVNAGYQKNCHKVILDTLGEMKRKASQELWSWCDKYCYSGEKEILMR